MEIGIGLPVTIPGVEREQVLEWARRAEQRQFSSLGTIDRLVYPNLEPLIALAAAAAVTDRIRLTTSILLAPLRANAALFAKQAATVQRLSGGRLVLGMSVGARSDDFEVSGIDIHERGLIFDRQLNEMKRVWAGDDIGPKVERPPKLIIGGSVAASFRRAARHGEGWMLGGGSPDQFAEGVERLREAWQREGRSGEPRKMALAYFSLGPDADKHARDYLGHYYAYLGEDTAAMIAASAAKDEDTVKQYLSAFEQLDCDEFILFPCSTAPEQVDLLAQAVGLTASA